MSVPKGRRGISDMEFFHLSNRLYSVFEDWLLRDFGVKDKVRSPAGSGESAEILRFPEWFIEHKRKIILGILDEYMDAIIAANTIYPATYAELAERRHYQNFAIGKLEQLYQYTQRTIAQLPLPKAKSAHVFDLIAHVISIVKLWRKANGKIKKILDGALNKAIRAFRAAGDTAPLLGMGLPESALKYILDKKEA
jgi:hypothetical protein